MHQVVAVVAKVKAKAQARRCHPSGRRPQSGLTVKAVAGRVVEEARQVAVEVEVAGREASLATSDGVASQRSRPLHDRSAR